VQRQVARAEAAAVGLATTLDHFEMPVLLVGATGRVAVLNAAAEAFIARPGCPLSVRCQQLSATSASAADALRRTIALAAAATPSAPPDLLRLPAGLDGETVCIMAVPVRHERRSALSIPDADAQVLLFIASNEARLSIKPAVLVSQFGFTAAEADVAASLAAGETIDTIANRRGVSRETVRAQVKSIFGKTGVQSQSQLIASLASSIGALRFAR
jgi:DNA-binding CsgD family transcriptional regulator